MKFNRQKLIYALAAPVGAFVLAIVVAGLALLASGKNPFVAFKQMLVYGFTIDSFVNAFNDSLALFVSGIAVAIGFKTNLFNIGVEGQYRLAAIVAGAVGAGVPGPGWFRIIVAMLSAVTVGALYAGIAGVLKAYRNVNEVISTIMLNGIVLKGLVAIMLQWTFIAKLRDQQYRTRRLPKSAWFPTLDINGSKLWLWGIIAIGLGVGYHYLVNKSRFGYELRTSGLNPGAALAAGVNPKRMILTTMLISGAVAGLVGMPNLLQREHEFTQQFPFLLGFGGIAVALVGRQKAGGMAMAALLFAFLTRSAQSLTSPPTRGTKEISQIMQGTMILAAVVAYEVVRRRAEAVAVSEAANKTAALTSEVSV
jgi:general nucleoside transport system permease protein